MDGNSLQLKWGSWEGHEEVSGVVHGVLLLLPQLPVLHGWWVVVKRGVGCARREFLKSNASLLSRRFGQKKAAFCTPAKID
jgi:hypothetical protein